MIALVLGVVLAQAPVARLPLSALPADLSTRRAFDDASRVQVVALARALRAMPAVTTVGQRRWFREEQERVIAAYAEASGDPESFDAIALKEADARFVSFWSSWVGEQLRLATLFPKPTSEIFTLEADDLTGNELPELTFALTFDDGPSPAGGTTDATIAALRAARWPGVFFVTGERLEGRKDLDDRYGSSCVASHGERHVPHTNGQAPASVAKVQKRLRASDLERGRPDLFRPPYGQRGEAVRELLRAEKIRTVLWNLDSQDWRADATADEVAGRLLALMLATRRGVVLLHDVHPIAPAVIPLLKHRLAETVTFVDCAGW